MKKIYTKLFIGFLFILGTVGANAQAVTTNSGSGLAATYADLASAITALNAATITSPVVITLTTANPQTAPAGGYSITQLGGTSTNTIIINGAGTGSTVTAASAPTVGSRTDAIFKIIGGDYITLQGFDMRENPVNTTGGAVAVQQMTEFGVALFAASTTDGAQNNTIQNNTITLSSATTYQNAIGIFSTTASSATNGAQAATSIAGTNSNNKFYSNTITGVAQGLYFISPTQTATVFESGNDIGGASGATANTITFGTSNTAGDLGFSSYSGATAAGVYFRNVVGNSVRFNTIISTATLTLPCGGIFSANGTAPTGITYTSAFSNNTITLTNVGTAAITGIDFGSGLSTGTIASSNNTITLNQNATTTVSAAVIGIKANYAASSSTLNTNSITINQAFTATATVTNSSSVTALTVPSGTTGTPTINVLGNTVTINRSTTVSATFTATMSGTQTGIQATTSTTTMNIGTTGAGNNNVITIKEAAGGGAGTTSYISAITYIDASANHATVNVVNNTLNTTGSTIRSTGSLICVNQNSTTTVLDNFKSNTVNIDRIAASGSVFFTSSTGTPSMVADTVSNNSITFTSLSGTTSVTAISCLGGPTGAGQKSISNNIINISGTNTGTTKGIAWGYGIGTLGAQVKSNNITIICAAPTVIGIDGSGSSAAANNLSGNTLSLTSSTTSPTSMIGINAASTGPYQISSNTFNALNFTGIITGSPVVSGIALSVSTGNNINNNVVTNISVGAATSTATPTVDGILISGGVSTNVYKNKIYGITTASNGLTTLVNGIRISGGGTTANNVYNNLIGDLTAPTAASTDAIRGISITSTTTLTTHNVYYNTIYINASSTGANFGTTGIFHAANATSTTATLNLRNNIIFNTSTAAGTGLVTCFRRSVAATLGNYGASSNNNDFYTTTGAVMHDGTTAFTIATFKAAVTPRDAASFSEDPEFQSVVGANANFLKYKVTSAKQIESGAVNISTYTDDYLGTIRQNNGGYAGTGTAPDIGAWELEGIAADLTGPSISYTTLGNTSCLTDRTLTPVTITDASGVNITAGTRPRLYYRRSAGPNTDANTFNDNTSGTAGWKYVEATGAGGSPFSFTTNYSLLSGGTGVATTNVIEYFVVAQDNVGTPNVSINTGTFTLAPTSVALVAANFPVTGSNSYTLIAAGISGTVTIGASGTYTSITQAGGLFDLINTGGISGNLTVNILDASVAETGAIALNAINYNGCAAGPYTVLIRPDVGVTSVLTGNSATSLIKLNGADYVTIDGSNNGTSSKNLTITNTNTATSGNAIIWIASATASDGATNNTVKNTIVTGNSETTTLMGIFSGGTASISTTGSALTNNSNNTIQNNTISKSQYGVFVRGVAVATLGTGLQVIQNTVGTATAGDGFSLTGITIQFQDGAIISNNEIQNQTSTSTANTGGIILLDTKNGTLNANNIHNLRYTGSSTGKIVGIHTSSATYNVVGNPSNITFSNNMVYDLSSTATSTSWNTSGISNNGGYNDKYYFNSVYLTGQMSNTGTGGSACFANGNGLTSTNCPVVDMRNNIFYMNGSSAAAATLYAHYTTVTTYSGSTLNYNNLLSSASGSATAQLGRFNATNYATLATWQTATGLEANSISSDPKFISATNLHINTAVATPVESAGTPIAGITTDYDNDTRNATTPDIGADEGTFITPVANDVQATAFIDPTNGGSKVTGVAFSPIASFTNNGTANQTNVPVRYRIVNAALVEIYNQTGTITTLNSGVTSNFTFPSTTIAIAGTYTIYAKAELVGDAVPANDEIIGTLIVEAPLCGTYMVGASQPAGFQNLTQAVGKLNALGITCSVIFELQTDYTSTGETYPLTINTITGASSTAAFTLRPASGVTSVITGSNAAAIIKINGGDFITIDGSNNNTTSRNLTIENTNAGTSSIVFWNGSASVSNGATDNVIKNTIVKGNAPATTFTGIFSGSGTTAGAIAESANTNFQAINNSVFKCQYGIAVAGVTGGQTGNVISNNSIGSNTAADYIGFIGFFASNVSGIQINNNTIFNVITTLTNPMGMNISGGVVNSTINANTIRSIRYTGTGGYGGKGMNINTGTATSNLTVSNNMISDIAGDGWNTLLGDAIVGIRIGATGGSTVTTGGINLYYNTVNLGSGTFVGNASGTLSAALYFSSTTSAIDLRDNILVTNLVNSTAATAKTYAINSAAANTAFTTIDYNDYFVSGTQGVLGNIASTDRTTLAAIITGFGGNANSLNIVPNFTSATDLHLLATNCGLDGYGTPIAGVMVDYDAQTRDAAVPDMGADEFTATYGTTLAGVIGSAVCDNKNVSASGTIYATSVCNLIATVLPLGGGTAVSGKINVCVTLDGSQLFFNGEPYVQRHHDIAPVTSPTTATATVSLYFTDAEFIAYNTTNPVRPPMPTAAGGGSTDPNRANILVTEFFGTPTTAPSKPGFYTLGTRVAINPLDGNITWNGSYWTVTFDVTGFGGFYVHSNVFGSPLPITINYFNGSKQGSNHLLNWKVTCVSTPRATMTLERSADSRNFTSINTIIADAVRCNQPFNYTDVQPLKGMNYYRLKMVDANGLISYSSIVALLNAVKGFEIISIAPNPVVDNNFKLNVTSATAATMQVIITDMQGRIVSRQSIPVIAGFSSIPMNVSNLAAGTYSIQAIFADEKTKLKRFVKQ